MTLPQLFFLLKKHVAGSRKSLRNQSSLISQSIWSRIFYSPSLVKFLDPASPILLGSKIWLWLSKVHNKSKQFDLLRHFAPVAQLVEQLPFKEMVAGSIPAGRTRQKIPTAWDFFALVRDGSIFFQ